MALLAGRQAAGLARLAQHPRIINPRQLGTVIAVEVEGAGDGYMSDLGPRLKAAFTQRDVLLRPLGNTVYVMPPYCIGEDDLTRIHDTILAVAGEL